MTCRPERRPIDSKTGKEPRPKLDFAHENHGQEPVAACSTEAADVNTEGAASNNTSKPGNTPEATTCGVIATAAVKGQRYGERLQKRR